MALQSKPHTTDVGIPVAELGGRRVHIRELEYLRGTSGRRPDHICPACGNTVRPRVGETRRAHFAHATRSDCWAPTPEGRRHLEAKHHLYAELCALDGRGRLKLGLPVGCGEDGTRGARPGGCATTARLTFGGWELVREEKRDKLTTRRPDLKLVDATGNTLLAIEIVHTNAVDERKAAEFFGAGVPWLEVDVSGDGLERVMGWTREDPDLPCTRTSVDFAWRCDVHASAEAPLFFRLIDNYFPKGEPWEGAGFRRDVYWVIRTWLHGEVRSNALWRRVGLGAPALLGAAYAEGQDSIGNLFSRTRQVSESSEPDSTVRDETAWFSLEHLPVGERASLLARLPTDETNFPRRRTWSWPQGKFVYSRRHEPKSSRDVEIMAHVMMHRLRGHDRPRPQRPHDPYEVPVIPSGLRAAWEADALWEMMLGHLTGEHPIAGIPAMTREEFIALVRGPSVLT